MALVIESGSVVPGADSYVTVTEARAFAAARASTLPATDPPVEAALISAIDYLESYRDQYQGRKVSADQSLQFPRSGVSVDGFPVPITTIPQILKNAQMQLAIDSFDGSGNPIDLTPIGDGREVIREKIDVLETEYSPGSGSAPQPVLVKVSAFLSPLLKSASGGLRAIRA